MVGLTYLVFIGTILTANSHHLNNERYIDDKLCNPTKADKLNVHIISHTHLDAGWVRTYDQYYDESVKNIMSTVIESLTKKNVTESRKFTFVEMAYFSRYWNSIGHKQRQVIKELVTTGKLQFTSGGWVMNDEASPHYSMIIDQMSYGHRWISKTFGHQYLPTTGWQIDPFGHTKEFASILSQIGFNALFLGRIDYQDKIQRMSDKSMEFIWKTDQNLKQNNYLFTGITPAGYYPMDGVSLNGYYQTNAYYLIKQLKEQIKGYRTNHIMVTMGGDFNYVYAELSFENLDQLIQYMNSISDEIHLVYSTPDCYVKSLFNCGIYWRDTKIDDFMPYADKLDDFWSGYFTSRPAFKYQMNYLNSILQISKQLIAKADIYSEAKELIRPLEESFGICLHHDAISGTSKQFVSNDYVRMLSNGLESAEQLIGTAYQKLFNSEEVPQFCHQLNISECLFFEQLNSFTTEIVLYNPLAHRRSHYMRLPLEGPNFQIQNSKEEIIESQIIPIASHIQSLAERKSSANYELIFEAVLEPFSFTKYYLKNILQPRQQTEDIPINRFKDNEKTVNDRSDTVIANNRIKVIIDGNTGLLKSIKKDNKDIGIEQNFFYYTRGMGRNSGAYAFHTNGQNSTIIAEKATITVIKGNICQEVIQEFTPYLKQIIRIYKNSDYVEFDWTVGPLPRDKDFELISQFNTDFKTESKFYTDSNGRQTEERMRDLRQTWNLKTSEKASSNYYPITSWIYIRDQSIDLQLTVLPDRTQGGSSLSDGSLELMIHRRLEYDDGYGMEEKLDEPGVDGLGLVVRGKHYLLIDNIGDSMAKVKSLSKELFYKPLPMFLPLSHNQNDLETKSESEFKGISITNKIHPSIHLLTLEELEPNVLFIRLEYILEKLESESETVSVLLNEIFSGIDIESMVETSLTGAETFSDMLSRKYKWNCDECDNHVMPSDDDPFVVTLRHNQIRSFILRVKRTK